LKLILVPAISDTELDELAQLAAQIWSAYYPPIIGEAQVTYMLQKFYSAAALLEQVKEGQRFYLVKSQTETLGFVALSSQEDWSVFINKFYLKIGEQNKGYGEQVFDLIKEKHPHSKLTLTVNRQNYKAINFYFKLGFKIQTVADFDIGNGYVMNDFVMVYEPLNE